MNKLIEIHALQNFAPSNLNRDDTGAPKDALFGGSRRARISSQCLKRAVRRYFGSAAKNGGLVPDDVATRTKRLRDAIVPYLVEKGRPEQESQEKTEIALAALGLPVKEDGRNEYLLFVGQREIREAGRIIDEKWDSLAVPFTAGEGKKGGKAKKDAAKNADKDLKDALESVLDGGKAIDVALFGRMLADMPERNQDAACQVAHAISTHVVDREFDFYTAVDDLKPDDTAGADMMGTVEFNSACFYRYAVVDWSQLCKNLQQDEKLALKGLRAFVEGFVVAEPTGKQNTFAAHNPPEFVAVSVRREAAPRNLANAFEIAVRAGKSESLTEKSTDALVNKSVVLNAAFGSEGNDTFILNLTGADSKVWGKPVKSLKELLDATIVAVKE